MHEYDIALKVLLQASTDLLLRQVTGVSVARWLNVEIPEVLSSRVDLLGETAEETLVHIELQSTNDSDMPLRMAEYFLRIYRQFKKFPKQIVLYVGEPKLSMKPRLRWPETGKPAFAFEYTLIDARELDGAQLLASRRIEDNLIAILTRLEDRVGAIREILTRIAHLEKPARRDALAQFLIISGVRRLAQTVKEEAYKMPILNDIMDHEVFGPMIRQGLEQGLKEGKQEGKQEVLRRMLEKRFGRIPDWVETQLKSLPATDLDDLGVRLLDASGFEDLFPQKQ